MSVGPKAVLRCDSTDPFAKTCKMQHLGGQKSVMKKHTPEICAMFKQSSGKMGAVDISFKDRYAKLFLPEVSASYVYISPG